MTPKEYAAAEAKRILDEVKPYFDKLEQLVVEDMARVDDWTDESHRKSRGLAERLKIIRSVQGQLQTVISQGISPKNKLGVV